MSRPRNTRAATTPTLACLLYRRNPRDHLSCASLTLTRPRDVKQHLLRDHRLPLYCPICGSSPFPSVEERDSHVQEGRCVTPPGSVLINAEGLDPGQVAQLELYRARRGQSVVSTWRDYWAIVFPDDPCHPRAFMGGHLEEVVDMFREDLNAQEAAHRNEIAASFPADQAGQIYRVSRRYLETALSGFLTRNAVANNRTATVLNPNPATTSQVEASNHGANPRLLANYEEPYPYSGQFGPEEDFYWFSRIEEP